MKLQKSLTIFILFIALCSCQRDVYNPDALGRDYFIQDIPENFDWSTTNSVNLKVIPADSYNSLYTYTIEIFGNNPLIAPESPLYSYGWANSNEPFQKDIIIPDTNTMLYVRQTSPGGRKSILIIPVSNSQMVCNFNMVAPTLKSRATTRATSSQIVTEAPANAIELEGSQDMILQPGKNYIINENQTYTGKLTFPGEGDCSLYIKGTWINPSDRNLLEKKSNIYILENGKLLAGSNCTLSFSQPNGMISIAPKGQLGNTDENNITIDFQSQGTLLNAGTAYCNSIKANSPNMYILNQGKLYVNEVSSENHYQFRNECYANVKLINLKQGAELYIAPSCSFISTSAINLVVGTVNLDNSSFLKANTINTSDWGKNQIIGKGNQPGLVEITQLNASANGQQAGVYISGNLHLRCKQFPSNQSAYNITCVIEDINTGSSIQIQPSECSQGNEYVPEEPQPPVFPRVITYNQSYTYTSEDNFPNPGDYDMNDLVLSIDSVSYYYKAEKIVNRMTWHITLRAAGATHRLGAAIQIDDLAVSSVKKVDYSKTMPIEVFGLNSNGTEKGQDYAVIPLFDNAHKVLGSDNNTTIINTINSPGDTPRYDVSPVSFDITIEFSADIPDQGITSDKFNYFTIVDHKPKDRTEIHLPQYRHTNLSNSPKQLQESTEKYMWTIKVPGIFSHPQEWTKITKAYPEFEKWVRSGRQNYKDWYTHPENELLYKK